MGEAAPIMAKYAPYLGMAMTALKVLQTVNKFRGVFGGRRRK
jgi:hypothetical protein